MWRELRALLRVGSDIAVRTGALLGSFVVATAVLARVGEPSLAAHQIAFQLFVFLALVLDALAIAGQVMVGRALGAGDAAGAADAGRRLIVLSVGVGCLFALLLLAGSSVVIPRAFTSDDAVLEQAAELWPLFALLQPVGAAVFALDGILIGAEDTRFIKWSMVFAALGVFMPICLLSLEFDWGVVGVWCGLNALMVARLATMGVRFVAWALGAGGRSGRARRGRGRDGVPLAAAATVADAHPVRACDEADAADDRDDEADEVQLEDAADGERAGDRSADDGAGDAEQDRPHHADALAAGKDETGEHADDDAHEDETKNLQ